MFAVVCGSLSQRCQWLSLVRQTKLTKVHFKTRELVLASVALVIRLQYCPPNLIIQWTEVGLGQLGPLTINDEVKAI